MPNSGKQSSPSDPSPKSSASDPSPSGSGSTDRPNQEQSIFVKGRWAEKDDDVEYQMIVVLGYTTDSADYKKMRRIYELFNKPGILHVHPNRCDWCTSKTARRNPRTSPTTGKVWYPPLLLCFQAYMFEEGGTLEKCLQTIWDGQQCVFIKGEGGEGGEGEEGEGGEGGSFFSGEHDEDGAAAQVSEHGSPSLKQPGVPGEETGPKRSSIHPSVNVKPHEVNNMQSPLGASNTPPAAPLPDLRLWVQRATSIQDLWERSSSKMKGKNTLLALGRGMDDWSAIVQQGLTGLQNSGSENTQAVISGILDQAEEYKKVTVGANEIGDTPAEEILHEMYTSMTGLEAAMVAFVGGS